MARMRMRGPAPRSAPNPLLSSGAYHADHSRHRRAARDAACSDCPIRPDRRRASYGDRQNVAPWLIWWVLREALDLAQTAIRHSAMLLGTFCTSKPYIVIEASS